MILLTTHHMEEAEILSDFVVILSRGKTVESGTLHQLKLKFGVGNQLKLTKKKQAKHTVSVLNVENEKFLILDSVSESTRAVLSDVEFQHLDSFSMVLKTGNLADEQLKQVLEELVEMFGERFYVAVNSCTFDDVFREIDRVYEQGAGGGQDSQIRAVFSNFIEFAKSGSVSNVKRLLGGMRDSMTSSRSFTIPAPA